MSDEAFDKAAATLRRMLVNDLFVEMPEEKIGLDDGLQTVVGLDSIGFSELRILSERKFQVTISDDDYVPENFSSVRRVATLVLRLQAKAQTLAGPHEEEGRMSASAAIAVTGIAWSTPLGDDLDAVWRRLCAGETGLVPGEPAPHSRAAAQRAGGAGGPLRAPRRDPRPSG